MRLLLLLLLFLLPVHSILLFVVLLYRSFYDFVLVRWLFCCCIYLLLLMHLFIVGCCWLLLIILLLLLLICCWYVVVVVWPITSVVDCCCSACSLCCSLLLLRYCYFVCLVLRCSVCVGLLLLLRLRYCGSYVYIVVVVPTYVCCCSGLEWCGCSSCCYVRCCCLGWCYVRCSFVAFVTFYRVAILLPLFYVLPRLRFVALTFYRELLRTLRCSVCRCVTRSYGVGTIVVPHRYCVRQVHYILCSVAILGADWFWVRVFPVITNYQVFTALPFVVVRYSPVYLHWFRATVTCPLFPVAVWASPSHWLRCDPRFVQCYLPFLRPCVWFIHLCTFVGPFYICCVVVLGVPWRHLRAGIIHYVVHSLLLIWYCCCLLFIPYHLMLVPVVCYDCSHLLPGLPLIYSFGCCCCCSRCCVLECRLILPLIWWLRYRRRVRSAYVLLPRCLIVVYVTLRCWLILDCSSVRSVTVRLVVLFHCSACCSADCSLFDCCYCSTCYDYRSRLLPLHSIIWCYSCDLIVLRGGCYGQTRVSAIALSSPNLFCLCFAFAFWVVTWYVAFVVLTHARPATAFCRCAYANDFTRTMLLAVLLRTYFGLHHWFMHEDARCAGYARAVSTQHMVTNVT